MYTVSDPKKYDPVRDLIATMLRQTKQIPAGSTQLNRAEENGIALGKREGQLDGIAAMLNIRRCERYSDMHHLPILVGSDLRKHFAAWVARFEHDGKIKDRNKRSENEAEMWAWIQECLDEVTYPADIEADRLEQRKRLIKAGEIEPDESDLDWLQADLKAANEAADKVAHMVEKVAFKQPRRIKDQPQA